MLTSVKASVELLCCALFFHEFLVITSAVSANNDNDSWSSSGPLVNGGRGPSLGSSSSTAGDDIGTMSPSEFAHRSLEPANERFVKSLKAKCDDGNLEVRVEVPNPFGGKIYARGYTGQTMCHGRPHQHQQHRVSVSGSDIASSSTDRRRRRGAIMGDLSRRRLDLHSLKLAPPTSADKSEKSSSEKWLKSSQHQHDTKMLVLTAPVGECGIKTSRNGVEDEYELYLYVQFDPHVQQVVDEQLLIKCSPTFGSGPMRETIVISKALGSGSNDVSTTAFVAGTGSGEKGDSMAITEHLNRRQGQGLAPHSSSLTTSSPGFHEDDEPRVPGTVVDAVLNFERPAASKKSTTEDMAEAARSREPHSHLLQQRNQNHNQQHRQQKIRPTHSPIIQKATTTPAALPSTATTKRIVVLDDFVRNRAKGASSSSSKKHLHLKHVEDTRADDPAGTGEKVIPVVSTANSSVVRSSEKFSAGDSHDPAVETLLRPTHAPVLKPSLPHQPAASRLKPTEVVYGWMEVSDPTSSNNLLDEPESLKVGQDATIVIKVRHRAGLVVRIVDCIAHDGSNQLLLDPTSHASPVASSSSTAGSNQQQLIDKNGCLVDSSIMPETFQQLPSSRNRREAAIYNTSGKSRKAPRVPASTPTDAGLIPSLKNRKAPGIARNIVTFEESRLYSTFKAFKFADNDEVHFKCTVMLCQNYCPLKSCRKRRNMSIGASSYSRQTDDEQDDDTSTSREADTSFDDDESGPKAARYTDDSSTVNVVPELLTGAKEEKNSGQVLATAVVFDSVSVRAPNLAEALKEAMTKPSTPPAGFSNNRSSFRRRDDQQHTMVPADTSSSRGAFGRTASSSPSLLSSSSAGPAEVESMSLEEQHLFCVTPSKMMLAFGVLLALLLVTVLAAATFCIRSRRYDQLVAARFAGIGGAPLMPRPGSAAATMGRPPSAIATPPYAHVIKPGSPYFRVMR